MSVQSDIAEIKTALDAHEADFKRARRSARRLHNLLSQALAAHGSLLGLAEGDVVALGGGTNKDDEGEE